MLDDLPIIDAHQHFWDLERNYLPWLRDEPMIPFRYGDYRALRRTYLPDDYLADSAGHDIVKTVYVETEWDPGDPVGETRWVHEIHEKYGFPHAVVAQAWLDRDDAAQVLAAQADFPLVRSIRHKPAAAAFPGAVKPGAPGGLGDPRWRAGYALLEQHGLSFDLQTPWWHLYEAAELAADFPATQIFLNHTGLPTERSAAALDGWRRALRALAEQPNVAVKISGLGLSARAWTVADNRPVVLDAIEIFGVERCMFASNFPVDSLVADFDTIFAGFKDITSGLSRAAREKLFHDNALRYYRLDES